MYIPSTNAMDNQNEVLEFMKRYSFASIISIKNGYPIATHLPFNVELIDNQFILSSHFAVANEQWKYLTEQSVLVIFTEPHAYISTSNYEKNLNVPTWNYLAVHIYGEAKLIEGYEETLSLLEKTINTYESSYKNKWDEFPEDYKTRMIKGIVGFEILVTDVQGKKKLSQNRTEIEKENIITSLSLSMDSNAEQIANYMKGK